MIVGNFNIKSVAVEPPEADAPLVVDGDGILPFPVTLQPMEPVTWGHLEIVQPRRQVDVLQFAPGSPHDVSRQSVRFTRREKVASVLVGESLYQLSNVMRHVTHVNMAVSPSSRNATERAETLPQFLPQNLPDCGRGALTRGS